MFNRGKPTRMTASWGRLDKIYQSLIHERIDYSRFVQQDFSKMADMFSYYTTGKF